MSESEMPTREEWRAIYKSLTEEQVNSSTRWCANSRRSLSRRRAKLLQTEALRRRTMVLPLGAMAYDEEETPA